MMIYCAVVFECKDVSMDNASPTKTLLFGGRERIATKRSNVLYYRNILLHCLTKITEIYKSFTKENMNMIKK